MDDETSSSDITISSKNQIDPLDPRICKKFFSSGCQDKQNCFLKHTLTIREVVCKFFLLNGHCYKGPKCPYLHEIIHEKLPDCKNETYNSKCPNPDCKFKHTFSGITKECIFYNQGFCQFGKFCKFKHISRKLCRNLVEKGSCEGECNMHHLEGPAFEEILEYFFYKKLGDKEKCSFEDTFLLCFRCMKFGHHPIYCDNRKKSRVLRCYSCFEYGHKSNKCDRSSRLVNY